MSWQLMSFLVLGAALALGFAWYERSRPPARVLALVAAMAALAVVGRLAFAPLPNVKPTTDIVLFAGYALGSAPGFAVGAVTALVSNVFLSHGPWTPWQMAAWGGVGVAGGALAAIVRGRVPWRRRRAASAGAEAVEARELGRWPLALACGVAGLGFGLVMDLYMWTLAAEQTPAAYVAISGRSLPFNVAHVLGNVAFCLVIGPPLVRALRRYRRRFEVRWAEPGARGAASTGRAAGVGAALALAVVAISLAGAPSAQADSTTSAAVRYLIGAQNPDGGFGTARGQPSSPRLTGWAALGLAAAGRNPRDVVRGKNSVIDYLARNLPASSDTGGIERMILVVRAAGLNPRRFAGRNLYSALLRRRDSDGSFDGLVDRTAFAILAIRASGESARSPYIQNAADWLIGCQNDSDGGFGPGCKVASDVDDTGGVLQALSAANVEGGRAAAIEYLNNAQRGDGGFGFQEGAPGDAQSTAYAVQGLVAAGQGVGRPLSYLRSLRAPDGSINKSRGLAASPVWVTGQALSALERKAFPLGPVPRDPAPRQIGPKASGGAPKANRKKRGASNPDKPVGAGAGAGTGGAGSGPGAGAGPGAPGAGAGSDSGTGGESSTGAGPASLGSPPPLSTPPEPRAPKPITPARAPGVQSANQRFSDAGPAPLEPIASRRPPRPAHDSGDGPGAAGFILGGLAVAVMAATALTARGRRLWATLRRRARAPLDA